MKVNHQLQLADTAAENRERETGRRVGDGDDGGDGRRSGDINKIWAKAAHES